MYTKKIFRVAIALFVFWPMIYALQACKKDFKAKPSTGQTDTGGFYFKADINGKPWQVDEDSMMAAVVNKYLIELIGVRITGADTSALAIALDNQNPKIELNKAIPITAGPSDQQVLSPVDFEYDTIDINNIVTYSELKPGSWNAYASLYTKSNAGVIRFSELDTVHHVVSGTFQTTLTDSLWQTKVITNGKFRLPVATRVSHIIDSVLYGVEF